MFHLLIRGSGWNPTNGQLGTDRVFEHTDGALVTEFMPEGNLSISKISKLPALFASELDTEGNQPAKVGYIQSVSKVGREWNITYALDTDVPPIPLEELRDLRLDLGIVDFEFRRTHWAIKDIDLFKILHTKHKSWRLNPTVFSFSDIARMQSDLISVMMPFTSDFAPVYESLKTMGNQLRMKCQRADDLWENEMIIADVVSLICRSKIVICDCTGKNPNVFYEAGIAHSIGKPVILIAQKSEDIPFDLRHLRSIYYSDDSDGLRDLIAKLSEKIQQLRS